LDDADMVLALLTPGSYISEICRAEQLRSLRHGKCMVSLWDNPVQIFLCIWKPKITWISVMGILTRNDWTSC